MSSEKCIECVKNWMAGCLYGNVLAAGVAYSYPKTRWDLCSKGVAEQLPV